MISVLPPLSTILIPLSLFLTPALSDYTTANSTTPHENSQSCSCYVLNSGKDSNTPEYFQYYRFYDFRSLANGPTQYINTPPLVNNTQDAASESVWDAAILKSDAWNTDWVIQNWSKNATADFPTRMVNSPANIYVGQNSDKSNAFTWLTLRTTRLDDFQSSAEVENEQKNMMHASMRMYGRVTGSKGAVAGFFTYYDDSNESDIEILTDDPTDMIHYTNQPALDKDGNDVPQASQNLSNLPAWDEWQTHRIDWLDKNSYWYLDDKQVAANTYSVPRKPSGLVINMWSNGGEWSGNMTVGDSAEFHIQWIELVFNTSGPVGGPGGGNKRSVELEERKAKGCTVVCKVDGVQKKGTPEVVSVSNSAVKAVGISWSMLVMVGMVSMIVGL